MWAWAALSGVAVVRLLLSLAKGFRLVVRARPLVDERIWKAVETAFTKLGLRAAPQLYASNHVRCPVIWCWGRRPALLLPGSAARGGTSVDWNSILCHELAHLKRRDHLAGLLGEVLVCVLPWQPLAWWAKRRLGYLSERACDDWVLACGQSAASYAESLLGLFPQKSSAFALSAVSRRKGLQSRIHNILEGKRSNPRSGRRWAYGAAVAMACIITAMAFAQTRAVALLVLPSVGAEESRIAENPLLALAESETDTSRGKSLDEAAADGDIDRIRLLLSAGGDVNERDRQGRTALHHAAEGGHKDVVELLIDKGANINVRNNEGDTPADAAIPPLTIVSRNQIGQQRRVEVVKSLVAKGAQISTIHLAAFVGDTEKIRSFLEQGIDVNARDKDGRTPLHLASMSGQEDVVRFLVSKGADVNAQTTYWDLRPLHAAVMYLNYEVARLLIDNGADVDTSPLWRARQAVWIRMWDAYPDLNMKDVDAIYAQFSRVYWLRLRNISELLLTRGADVNEKDVHSGMTLLHAAPYMGLKDAVELFIVHGADVNAKDENGMTPLHAVIVGSPVSQSHKKGMVEVLISKGADVNVTDSQGGTPLWYAKEGGYKEIVELLRKHGAKDAAPGASLHLHQAASKGDIDEIKSLIARGADINTKDKEGRTPLHTAARSCQKELVQLMLAKGADVNTKDKRGWRPLDEAVTGGHKEVVELLIEAGADVNVQSEAGYTPLQTACFRGQREVVELLIAKGADLEIENQLGQRALHVAVYFGHPEVAKLLVGKGANVDLKDNEGRTALQLAKEKGQTEIVKLLLKHGAKE